jgi:hypothetical protein
VGGAFVWNLKFGAKLDFQTNFTRFLILGRRTTIGITMAKVECVLLDITGVLKEGDAPIAGSIEAVKK